MSQRSSGSSGSLDATLVDQDEQESKNCLATLPIDHAVPTLSSAASRQRSSDDPEYDDDKFPPSRSSRKSEDRGGSIDDADLDDELDALEAEAATYGRTPSARNSTAIGRGLRERIQAAVDWLETNRSLLVGTGSIVVGVLILGIVVRSMFTFRGSATDNELDSTYEPNASNYHHPIQVNRTSTFNGVIKYGPDGDIKPVDSMPGSEVTSCSYDSSDMVRYSALLDGQEGPILLAMNLFDNENILPTFIRELPRLITLVGRHNVHVSIYENGSKDRTVELIKHLAWWFHRLGATYTIHAMGEAEQSHKEDGHRIHVLAELRNKLLEPLTDNAVVAGVPFKTVLFLNDIQFCVTDVLEVLLQKRMQRSVRRPACSDVLRAHLATAVDYNYEPPRFYDQWVTRDMDGYTVYAKSDWETNILPVPFPHRPDDQARYYKLLPIQMFSSWNGIAAFSASVFLPPHNIRFRTSHDTSKHSECLLIAIDMWKAKLSRIVMATRARVAYTVGDYNSAKQMGQKELDVYRKLGAWDPQTERIDFSTTPPKDLLLYEWAWLGEGGRQDWRDLRRRNAQMD